MQKAGEFFRSYLKTENEMKIKRDQAGYVLVKKGILPFFMKVKLKV